MTYMTWKRPEDLEGGKGSAVDRHWSRIRESLPPVVKGWPEERQKGWAEAFGLAQDMDGTDEMDEDDRIADFLDGLDRSGRERVLLEILRRDFRGPPGPPGPVGMRGPAGNTE